MVAYACVAVGGMILYGIGYMFFFVKTLLTQYFPGIDSGLASFLICFIALVPLLFVLMTHYLDGDKKP